MELVPSELAPPKPPLKRTVGIGGSVKMRPGTTAGVLRSGNGTGFPAE